MKHVALRIAVVLTCGAAFTWLIVDVPDGAVRYVIGAYWAGLIQQLAANKDFP